MVELELLGVSQSEGSPVPVVWLRHEDRVLPILVGLHEATAIQLGLMKEKFINNAAPSSGIRVRRESSHSSYRSYMPEWVWTSINA